ncbi:secreted protein [Melampsora americana]|nr:secreted protein [Melampsora americana]
MMKLCVVIYAIYIALASQISAKSLLPNMETLQAFPELIGQSLPLNSLGKRSTHQSVKKLEIRQRLLHHQEESNLSQIRKRSLETRDGLLPFLPIGALLPTTLNAAPVKSLTGTAGRITDAGNTGSKQRSGLLKIRRAAS